LYLRKYTNSIISHPKQPSFSNSLYIHKYFPHYCLKLRGKYFRMVGSTLNTYTYLNKTVNYVKFAKTLTEVERFKFRYLKKFPTRFRKRRFTYFGRRRRLIRRRRMNVLHMTKATFSLNFLHQLLNNFSLIFMKSTSYNVSIFRRVTLRYSLLRMCTDAPLRPYLFLNTRPERTKLFPHKVGSKLVRIRPINRFKSRRRRKLK